MASTPRPTEPRDFRQDLTDNIVRLIEGGVAPWQKPWSPDQAGSALRLPFNATTDRAYRGANALHLMARMHQLGSDDPRWCTYKQASANGWQVRKGEKGTTVEYWQFDGEEERDRADGQREKVAVKLARPRVFYATVFNAAQIDGITSLVPQKARQEWEVSADAERALSAVGVPIHHDQRDGAYYSPSADAIHLPPRAAFSKPADFYEVALHEVGHATGHPSRLNRDLSGPFGSPSYAREELRAQMCSLYLSVELGVPFNPDRHAAYQASWVASLQGDKNEIFRAARDAELMADYVIGLSREKPLSQEIEMVDSASQNPGAALPETTAAPQSQDLNGDQIHPAARAARDFFGTQPEDVHGRVVITHAMRDAAKQDPGYRAELERAAPGLSKLANARTTLKQREEIYAAGQALVAARPDVDHSTGEDLAVDGSKDLPAVDPRAQEVGQRFINELTAEYGRTDDKEIESFLDQVGAQHRGMDHHGSRQAAIGEAVMSRQAYASDEHPKPAFVARLIQQLNEEREMDTAQQPVPDGRAGVDALESGLAGQSSSPAMPAAAMPDQLPLGHIPVMSVRDEQRYRSALETGNRAEADQIKKESAAEFSKEAAAQLSLLESAKARVGAGQEAKMYLPRDNAKYTGEIIDGNDRYALQRLRDSNSFVAHPIGKLQEAGVTVHGGQKCLIEYKDGRLSARDPEVEQGQGRAANSAKGQSRPTPGQGAEGGQRTINSELLQLKDEHAGKDAKLVMAKDANGTAYTGTIIAETADKVLQRVSDKYVVVHEKNKLARDVEVGSDKRLAYENGRIDVLDPSMDRNRSRAQEAERAGERAPDRRSPQGPTTPEDERKQSFFMARGVIVKEFGSGSKVHDAKTDVGDYRGAVVALTTKHVAQQIGANSFVVHERDRLAGNYHKGSHVQIRYADGRAISSLTNQQREQSRDQSQGRGISR